jgi:hypothetical protein
MNVPILTAPHVPNLTFYDPNLTRNGNVPKIEQCNYQKIIRN